jgi:hypothetical protein
MPWLKSERDAHNGPEALSEIRDRTALRSGLLGSCSFRCAVLSKLMIGAARWPARSLLANR